MPSDYNAIRADNERRYGTDIGRIGPMLLAGRYDDRTDEIRRACRQHGLPEPVSLTFLGHTAYSAHPIRWMEFVRNRSGEAHLRGHGRILTFLFLREPYGPALVYFTTVASTKSSWTFRRSTHTLPKSACITARSKPARSRTAGFS